MIGQQLLEVMVNAYLWIYVMNSMYVFIFATTETITMPYAEIILLFVLQIIGKEKD